MAVCNIPSIYHGDWYSQEAGVDVKTNVAFDKWRRDSVPQEQLECISIYTHPQQSSIIGGMNSSMVNTTMLMGILYVSTFIIVYRKIRYGCIANEKNIHLQN